MIVIAHGRRNVTMAAEPGYVWRQPVTYEPIEEEWIRSGDQQQATRLEHPASFLQELLNRHVMFEKFPHHNAIE